MQGNRPTLLRFAAPIVAALLAACSGAPASAPAPDAAPQAITLPTTGPRRVEIHTKGKAAVAHGPKERCEAHVAALHGYGLWATMQKDR